MGNLFSFCTAVFVNDIPDILFGLSLLVFFSPTLKMNIFRPGIFWDHRGSRLEHFADKTSKTTSGLHRKECYNHLSMSTCDQLSVSATGVILKSSGTFTDPFLELYFSRMQAFSKLG